MRHGVTSSKGLGTRDPDRLIAAKDEYHKDPLVERHPHQHQRLPELVRPAPHRGHRLLRHGDTGRRAADPGGAADAGGNARGTGKLAKLTMKLPAKARAGRRRDAREDYVAERTDGEKFAGWTERTGTARIQELLADYKIVPEFTKDPMAYVDWGQSKFFTLDDMGEGECAV